MGNNILKIGEGAFAFCSSLEKAVIPPGCTEIEKAAFFMCDRLKKVDFGTVSYMKSIGEGAFSGTGLTKFIMPDSVEIIGKFCFSNCSKMKKVVIGSGCNSIGEGAFAYCKELRKLSCSKSNMNFKSSGGCIYSFDGTQLISGMAAKDTVKLKNVLKVIDDYAFEGNEKIENISFPGYVQVIGECAFMNAEKLKNVELDDKLNVIGENAFFGCTSLERITIPEKVEMIMGNPFKYCTSLSELSVSNSNKRFRVSDGLLIDRNSRSVISAPVTKRTVNIPENALHIGEFAFCGNTMVKKVVLNKKLKNVGQGAFYDCSLLKKVSIAKRSTDFSVPEYISVDGEDLFCGIFGNCASNLNFDIPYDENAGARGSIEYYIEKHCNNGVVFKE